MPSMPATHSTKETLIHFVQRLTAGEAPEAIKPKLRQILLSTSPLEIAHLESELLRENHPQKDLLRLYGLQVELFRELYAH
jgi:DUF438 domain-containing protein